MSMYILNQINFIVHEIKNKHYQILNIEIHIYFDILVVNKNFTLYFYVHMIKVKYTLFVVSFPKYYFHSKNRQAD